jgi:hypothetical protein
MGRAFVTTMLLGVGGNFLQRNLYAAAALKKRTASKQHGARWPQLLPRNHMSSLTGARLVALAAALRRSYLVRNYRAVRRRSRMGT